jgi:ABC-type transporter Mla maintaining outer membrane lipid asymmetry ATPase subunit MlaF
MSENISNPTVIEMTDASISTLRDSSLIIVENVNWSVESGEFWVVAGQQQSGKSDLLMTAAGLLLPSRGSCRVFGCETDSFGEAQLAERLRVGFVFAGGKLFSQLTVAENVALPLRYQKNLSAAEAARDVETLLEIMELTPFAESTPANLATNWRQRAGRARALILKPELLLLDQPLSGLGARHRQWLLQFLEQLQRGHEWLGGQPLTIIASTDDLRSWRNPQRKFAVLDEKIFSVLGFWNESEFAHNHAVKELLAEPAGAIM